MLFNKKQNKKDSISQYFTIRSGIGKRVVNIIHSASEIVISTFMVDSEKYVVPTSHTISLKCAPSFEKVPSSHFTSYVAHLLHDFGFLTEERKYIAHAITTVEKMKYEQKMVDTEVIVESHRVTIQ